MDAPPEGGAVGMKRMIDDLKQYFSKRRIGCSTCANNGIEGSIIDKFPMLRVVEPMKRGHLYQCQKCYKFWYLHEHKKWLHRIYDSHLELVRYWNKGHFSIEESIKNDLVSIGGVIDYYKDRIFIPCACVEKSGKQILKAVVIISKCPPYNWPSSSLIQWSDQILSISPSQFSLPKEIRASSFSKREESMGFAPLGIKDNTGREYTLGHESLFFDHRGIKGADVLLSGRKRWWKEIVMPKEAEAYYFVDWFEQCEELFIAGISKNLEH